MPSKIGNVEVPTWEEFLKLSARVDELETKVSNSSRRSQSGTVQLRDRPPFDARVFLGWRASNVHTTPQCNVATDDSGFTLTGGSNWALNYIATE